VKLTGDNQRFPRILEPGGNRILDMLQPKEVQLPTRLPRNVIKIEAVPHRQHDAFDAGALRGDEFFLHAADWKHKAAQTYLARQGCVIIPDVPAGQKGGYRGGRSDYVIRGGRRVVTQRRVSACPRIKWTGLESRSGALRPGKAKTLLGRHQAGVTSTE
jgi:hypothetical protein